MANLWKRAAVAAVAIVVPRLWSRSPAQDSPPDPLTRLELDLGDSAVMRSAQVGSSSVIISPDGSRLVFVSFRNQEPRLMTRVLNEIGGSEWVELPGTAGVRGPFFSPDRRGRCARASVSHAEARRRAERHRARPSLRCGRGWTVSHQHGR